MREEEQPAEFLLQHLSLFTEASLPGPVLDLACGDGRNGLHLARRGLPVVGMDASREALDRGRQRAKKLGIANMRFLRTDLEREGINPLGEDRYGGILVFRYLHRPLMGCIRKALKDEGILLYETFTVEQKRFGKPRNPLFLLEPGELPRRFRDWEILYAFEGILESPRRAMARLAARKPPEALKTP